MILPELPTEIRRLLRPYQVRPAQQLLRALQCGPSDWSYSGAVDLSDVGIGKTYQDLAAGIAIGKRIGVLCPPAGFDGWRAAFAHFGATPAFVESWEAVRGGFRPNIARRTDGGFVWAHRDLMLICDEAQTCRNMNSLTSFAMEGIFAPGIPCICASATLAIAPYELYIAGRITGLHDGSEEGWQRFLADHGCRWDTENGKWRFRDDPDSLFGSHLGRINDILIPYRGCRVLKSDCGEQPTSSVRLLPLEPPEAESIRANYKEALEAIKRLRTQAEPISAIAAKMMTGRLNMRTMQSCELALVGPVAELAKADLDQDKSVVMFFTYDASRVKMARLLNRWEGLHGKASKLQRSIWVNDFQADRIHVLLNNIGAGGSSVSLHDLHGRRERVAYIFPTSNPVHSEQAPGRIHRVGGVSESKQWLPCILGTISHWTMKRTAEKVSQLRTLNNGSL